MDISPNILVTNYCNQNCSFCFANELMTKDMVKEMNIIDYKKLLDYLKKNGSKKVYLMGGEPTLHSNFKDLIDISVKEGFGVELFTNANFSEETEKYLFKNCNNISMFHVNIGAPSYLTEVKNKKINDFIKKVSERSVVSLETTIGSLDKTKYLEIFKKAEDILEFSSVRIGVDGGLINRGGFSIKKNLKIGKIIMSAVDFLLAHKVRSIWISEVNACMFSERQLKVIETTKEVTLNGFGCLSKRAGVDIKTDLRVIRCFGLDCLEGYKLDDSLKKIKTKLDKDMIENNKLNLPNECWDCKYRGIIEGKCPGPCLIGRQ